jgi:hypothetical protein
MISVRSSGSHVEVYRGEEGTVPDKLVDAWLTPGGALQQVIRDDTDNLAVTINLEVRATS